MFRRSRLLAVSALLVAVAATFAMVSTAYAHHPEVYATIACDTGQPVINYTVTAWTGTDNASRTNPEIGVYIDGVQVATGEFKPSNSFSFSGVAAIPAGKGAGDTVEVKAVALAEWGNGGAAGESDAVTLTIPSLDCSATATGRFTGGGNQVVVGGARVTRGLTIHCDLLLSNNLEVNWTGGNKFHMTEHLTTVACSDSPVIIQAPPDAPLDTLVGVGTGRYNNVDGFTIEFTLVDYGEPGSSDQARLYIYETANPANVVLNVPLQVLSGGNLQAHYDQPHK